MFLTLFEYIFYVLVSCGWFLLSAVLAAIRGEGRRQ